jgi:hypothetical protein
MTRWPPHTASICRNVFYSTRKLRHEPMSMSWSSELRKLLAQDANVRVAAARSLLCRDDTGVERRDETGVGRRDDAGVAFMSSWCPV